MEKGKKVIANLTTKMSMKSKILISYNFNCFYKKKNKCLWFGISIPKGFQFSCISGFFLKNFCGLDQLWFGSIFLDFSISGFFLKNFCGLEFQSKRISIFLHFWIFLKELLWFGFFKKILLLKKF